MPNGASLEIEGMKQLQRTFKELAEVSRNLARQEVKAAVLDIQRVAKRKTAGAGSGRAYKRGGVMHRASKPFDSPARDTGALGSRLSAADAIAYENDELTATFGARHYPIATYLEFGTSKMAPRPFLFRSFEEVRPKIVKNMAKRISEFFKQYKV